MRGIQDYHAYIHIDGSRHNPSIDRSANRSLDVTTDPAHFLVIFIPGHGSRLASRGNTWAHPRTLFFSFLTLTFYPSIHNFRTSVDPSMNLLVTVLPVTFPSCWNVLSNPLLSSCTSLRSALVLFRLGLPATKIDLAYLYKALAFTHLYVPQSCYHKSSCLSTSGCTTSTSAILTFAPLHLRSIIELLVENPLFTNSPKADTSLRLSASLLTWLLVRLNQAHLQDIVRNLKTIT